MPHPAAIHTIDTEEMTSGDMKPFISTVLYTKNSAANFRKATPKDPKVAKYSAGSCSILKAVKTHNMHVIRVHAEKVLPNRGFT